VAEFVYPPVIATALGIFRALDLRFSVDGAEHIPVTGPAVLAANHVSYLDFTFVGFAAHHRRRFVRFLAKRSVFDSRLSGPLMRGMHHIPVDRQAGAGAYREAMEALRAGELVGVFPESTISRSFVPREFRSGAARMAAQSGAPLIPMVTWGGQRLWTSGRSPRIRRHVPITIRIGEAVPIPAGADPRAVTATLRERILALADEAQRGYPELPGPGEDWWLPKHLGGTAPDPSEAAAIELAAIAGRRSSR
jgi:1-acyl-sn-glycerol-3-phosphate acyltransferase